MIIVTNLTSICCVHKEKLQKKRLSQVTLKKSLSLQVFSILFPVFFMFFSRLSYKRTLDPTSYLQILQIQPLVLHQTFQVEYRGQYTLKVEYRGQCILQIEYRGQYIHQVEYRGQYILQVEYRGQYILQVEYRGQCILQVEFRDQYILQVEYRGKYISSRSRFQYSTRHSR